MSNKDKYELMAKIAKRADEKGLLFFDRISLIMDLEHADNEFNLRLNDLLSADVFNFAHDVIGIQRNIDRVTGEMNNHFVPRYTTNEL